MLTLALAVGFAVVGVAGAASAHHNTVAGTVSCKQGGGWTVTWTIANSENISETITQSNRAVVPVGTVIAGSQTRTVTETVTTKPTSAVNLTVQGKWVRDGNAIYSTNGDQVEVGEFSDGCNVTTVTAPTVPVVDDCGPGNARFGDVPAGPWTSTTNADGSLTVTADAGYTFPDGQESVTYPKPTDSNVPCPTPPTTTPPVTPPVVTPPVTTPPEVLPAQVLVVKAGARSIDKCGRRGDMFKVTKRDGVVYTAKGSVLRQGVWLKARTRTVTVRATAADATYKVRGRSVWKLTFTRKACAQAPEVAPHTGS